MEYYNTEIGIVQIIYDKKIITSITFLDDKKKIISTDMKFAELCKKIKKYKYSQEGTEFQKTVWKEIERIPFGETRTYQQIAENINRPNSYRAVANACGKNNLALLIPCHRVTSKNDIGGYKWNINRKIKLLEFENQNIDYKIA